MKKQEAIELLKGMQHPLQDYADMVGAPSWANGCWYVYPDPEDYAIKEAITALEEKQNMKWIPVEERLPEPGQIVLVFQDYSQVVTIGRLKSEDVTRKPYWEFQYYRPDFKHGTIMDNGIICPGSEYVTHWMPLPDSPQN